MRHQILQFLEFGSPWLLSLGVLGGVGLDDAIVGPKLNLVVVTANSAFEVARLDDGLLPY